jgi:hypothetical protein
MKVAWQELPGIRRERETRPGGNGMIAFASQEVFSLKALSTLLQKVLFTLNASIPNQSHRTLRDGRTYLLRPSRQFLPGYLHLVPAGQRARSLS